MIVIDCNTLVADELMLTFVRPFAATMVTDEPLTVNELMYCLNVPVERMNDKVYVHVPLFVGRLVMMSPMLAADEGEVVNMLVVAVAMSILAAFDVTVRAVYFSHMRFIVVSANELFDVKVFAALRVGYELIALCV